MADRAVRPGLSLPAFNRQHPLLCISAGWVIQAEDSGSAPCVNTLMLEQECPHLQSLRRIHCTLDSHPTLICVNFPAWVLSLWLEGNGSNTACGSSASNKGSGVRQEMTAFRGGRRGYSTSPGTGAAPRITHPAISACGLLHLDRRACCSLPRYLSARSASL